MLDQQNLSTNFKYQRPASDTTGLAQPDAHLCGTLQSSANRGEGEFPTLEAEGIQVVEQVAMTSNSNLNREEAS